MIDAGYTAGSTAIEYGGSIPLTIDDQDVTIEATSLVPMAVSTPPVTLSGLPPRDSGSIPLQDWADRWDMGAFFDGGSAYGLEREGFVLQMDDDGPVTVQEVVVTGQKQVTEYIVARSIAALTVNPLDHGIVSIANLLLAPGEHFYLLNFQVGDGPEDMDEAMDGLLRVVTPGQDPTQPAHDGSQLTVPLLGPVVQTVDFTNHTLTNTTLPGHALYPGSVKFHLTLDAENKVVLQVTGSGTGNGALMNTVLSNPLWGLQATQLSIYVHLHDND